VFEKGHEAAKIRKIPRIVGGLPTRPRRNENRA
jgi:hypothetical protein